MPRIQLIVEVPRTEFQQLEEVARSEDTTVRGLLVWMFKSDIVARARRAAAERCATEPDAA